MYIFIYIYVYLHRHIFTIHVHIHTTNYVCRNKMALVTLSYVWRMYCPTKPVNLF